MLSLASLRVAPSSVFLPDLFRMQQIVATDNSEMIQEYPIFMYVGKPKAILKFGSYLLISKVNWSQGAGAVREEDTFLIAINAFSPKTNYALHSIKTPIIIE